MRVGPRAATRTQLLARAKESLFVMSYTMMAAAAPGAWKQRVRQSAAVRTHSAARTSVVHRREAVVALLPCCIPAGTEMCARHVTRLQRAFKRCTARRRTKSRTSRWCHSQTRFVSGMRRRWWTPAGEQGGATLSACVRTWWGLQHASPRGTRLEVKELALHEAQHEAGLAGAHVAEQHLREAQREFWREP